MAAGIDVEISVLDEMLGTESGHAPDYDRLNFTTAGDFGIYFTAVKHRSRQSRHKYEAQIPLHLVDTYVTNEEQRGTCKYVVGPVCAFHFILFYFILIYFIYL